MKPVQCEHCSRRFADTAGLWMHMKSKHRDKKHAHLRPESEMSEAELQIEIEQVGLKGLRS